MNKRCLKEATFESIVLSFFLCLVALPIFLIFKIGILKLLYLTLIFGIGYHVGYCFGFYYSEEKSPYLIAIPFDIIFLLGGIVTNTPLKCVLSIIVFTYGVFRSVSEGQAFYLSLSKNSEEEDE